MPAVPCLLRAEKDGPKAAADLASKPSEDALGAFFPSKLFSHDSSESLKGVQGQVQGQDAFGGEPRASQLSLLGDTCRASWWYK